MKLHRGDQFLGEGCSQLVGRLFSRMSRGVSCYGEAMRDSGSSFSERFNYAAPDAEITIREDAPEVLRVGLTQLAYNAEISGKALRDLICAVLLQRPDYAHNWGA